jgi:putative proteasome-type protease
MTYCVGIRLKAGLVFLSDTRTNAGVDNFSSARKMTVFEQPGDRLMVAMTAGNLAISQAVKQILCERLDSTKPHLWNVQTMADAVQVVGRAVREVHARDADTLHKFGLDFNVSVIFGGQIGNERPRLFCVYAAGNYIEAHSENCFFQIGESKYGKPILDRVITPLTSLDEAAKCALISMDSTLKSNLSVGLPLDLLVYDRDSLRLTHYTQIDDSNRYFAMIRNTWGRRLRQIFSEIEDPSWETSSDALVEDGALSIADEAKHKPIRAKPPVLAPRPAKAAVSPAAMPAAPAVVMPTGMPEVTPAGVQTLAQTPAAATQPASGAPPER